MNTKTASKLSTSSEFVVAAGEATIELGQRLGLYEAFDCTGAMTSGELSRLTHLPRWFVEGWLVAQSRAEYVLHDVQTDRYSLAARN